MTEASPFRAFLTSGILIDNAAAFTEAFQFRSPHHLASCENNKNLPHLIFPFRSFFIHFPWTTLHDYNSDSLGYPQGSDSQGTVHDNNRTSLCTVFETQSPLYRFTQIYNTYSGRNLLHLLLQQSLSQLVRRYHNCTTRSNFEHPCLIASPQTG